MCLSGVKLFMYSSLLIKIPIVFPIVSHKMKMSVYDKDPGMSKILLIQVKSLAPMRLI
jgi:hypothetical protein